MTKINDNIVAYWRAGAPGPQRRQPSRYDYRLYWQDARSATIPRDIARVIATRDRPRRQARATCRRPKDKRKFVIDSRAARSTGMAARFDVEPVVTVSSGTVETAYVIKVVGTNHWRATLRHPHGRTRSRSTCAAICASTARPCRKRGFISSSRQPLPKSARGSRNLHVNAAAGINVLAPPPAAVLSDQPLDQPGAEAVSRVVGATFAVIGHHELHQPVSPRHSETVMVPC